MIKNNENKKIKNHICGMLLTIPFLTFKAFEKFIFKIIKFAFEVLQLNLKSQSQMKINLIIK